MNNLLKKYKWSRNIKKHAIAQIVKFSLFFKSHKVTKFLKIIICNAGEGKLTFILSLLLEMLTGTIFLEVIGNSLVISTILQMFLPFNPVILLLKF